MIYSFFMLLNADLENILSRESIKQGTQRGMTILVFGGTGFIGKWIVGVIAELNRNHSANIDLTIVTRDYIKAQQVFEYLGDSKPKIIQFDLSKKEIILQRPFTHIIYGATPTSNFSTTKLAEQMIASSRNTANSILKWVLKFKHSPTIIHLSSGAIYGTQPMEMVLRSEQSTILTSSENPYIESKILLDKTLQKLVIDKLAIFISARLFAFMGPYLPMNSHFAAGNFMNSISQNSPIVIQGNPLTTRSYLYPTDLMEAIIYLLGYSESTCVNIGSSNPIQILNLAHKFASFSSNSKVIIEENFRAATNYVPDCTFLQTHLTDWPRISLDQAIMRWLEWLDLKIKY